MRFLCQIDAFAPGQALMGDKLFKTGEETFKTKVARLLQDSLGAHLKKHILNMGWL